MPTESIDKTLVRVLEMMRCLPRHGSGASAEEILKMLQERGYQVQKRTIERDLKTLHQAFDAYIKCNDKARPYGWRWQDNAEFDVVSMSVTDALSLHAIDEAIKHLLPASVLASLQPRFKQARTTLAELAGKNKHANWAKKVRSVEPGMPMQPPQVDAGILNTVQECLLSDEYIRLHYQKPGEPEPGERLLQPLALVQRGPTTYLVAIRHDEDAIKIYAVHRIRSAERSYLPADKCLDFDIDEYIAEGHLQFGDSRASGKEIKLKARIADWLMNILNETPLSADQQLTRESDQCWVEARVRDTSQLQWWILSLGSAMEVTEPQELRERIAKTVRATARIYASGSER